MSEKENLFEQLLQMHVSLLKSIDSAEKYGNWQEVTDMAVLCRSDLRRLMIKVVEIYLDNTPTESIPSYLPQLLESLRSGQ